MTMTMTMTKFILEIRTSYRGMTEKNKDILSKYTMYDDRVYSCVHVYKIPIYVYILWREIYNYVRSI